MFVQRLLKLYQRRKVAAQLGVRFERSATFRLPNDIVINDCRHRLSLPDENGVKVAFIDLLLDDCYGCQSLKKRGEQIRTVLDIGGNVGLFGVAVRGSFPDATIHSYEPNPNLEKYLSVQAYSAGFEYFMEAVGLEEGMISLEFNEDSVQTRSKQDDSGNVHQIAFRVAIERLGGKVDLLKMDCEGAEWEIFKDRESWEKVSNLAMEYHLFDSEHSERRVKEIVGNFGFRIISFNPIGNFGLLLATRK